MNKLFVNVAANVSTSGRIGTARIALLVICAGMVAAIPPARATEITYTDITTETLNGSFGVAPFGGSFPQFNPDLGTLNAVTLNISGDGTYSIQFFPDPSSCGAAMSIGNNTCAAPFFFSTGFSFNAPGFPVTDPWADFFQIANWLGDETDQQATSETFGPFGITYGGSPAGLTGYIGNGDISVLGALEADSTYCDDEGIGCDNLETSVDIRTSLSYDFTPVPEPRTLALFMAGLLAMASMRRRVHINLESRPSDVC